MATILIVDDQAASRDFLVKLLGYRGHRLLQAANGTQALEIAAAEHPDALITDVLMPEMDGYELAKRVRADAALSHTRVIFHTAHNRDPQAERLARECGVRFVLPKPCDPQQVLDTVEQVLGPGAAIGAPGSTFDGEHLSLISTKLYETMTALLRAQSMAKLSHVITGPDGTFETWSPALPALAGLAAERMPLDTRGWLELVHAEDRALFRATCIEAGAEHRPKHIEYRLQRAGGTVIHVRHTMEPLDAHAQGRWFNTLQDVTDQKAVEQRMADMARRLATLQEKERRDIARELHDRVGQNLAALSINLARLKDSIGGTRRDPPEIADSIALVKLTGASIQDVLTELKPPMLASYGLVDALRFHARELQRRSGIAIAVEGVEPTPRLPAELEMALFRIAQAALVNVLQHAEAGHAWITLQAQGDGMHFEIRDDGRGFDVDKALASGRWGLAGMRERAEAIGGELAVESAPGRGTRIAVALAER